jgi:hypothetical protein
VIGVVERDARLENGRGVATVRFDSGPDGEDAFRKVKEGTLRNVSVGYATYRLEKVEGGRRDEVPTYRATDWEPHEISMVPIGADAGAVTRSAGGTNPCEFFQEHEHMKNQGRVPRPTSRRRPPRPRHKPGCFRRDARAIAQAGRTADPRYPARRSRAEPSPGGSRRGDRRNVTLEAYRARRSTRSRTRRPPLAVRFPVEQRSTAP